jgi:hypothetical protein
MSCNILVIKGDGGESAGDDAEVEEDWRKVLIEYISNPSCNQDQKIRRQALKYCVIDGSLYHQTVDGLLLRCLSKEEARIAMGEVHEGMCGAHQSGQKM